MAQVRIFWDPTGLTVGCLGKKRFLRATDGDTPEVHYPGIQKPSKQDGNLAQLATCASRTNGCGQQWSHA